MRTAPVQLSQISFRRVSVELDAARIPEDGSAPKDVAFDLDRVNIATHVSFSPTDESEEPGTSFLLALRVVIDNPSTNEADLRFSPYLVDIEAGAVVRALPGAEVLGDIQDIIVVNGTSMLWSAIREQVCTLTARMPAGLIMLPTVNFHDLKRQNREPEAPNGTPTAKPRPGTRRKAAKPADA
jgi:hypothetical protein